MNDSESSTRNPVNGIEREIAMWIEGF